MPTLEQLNYLTPLRSLGTIFPTSTKTFGHRRCCVHVSQIFFRFRTSQKCLIVLYRYAVFFLSFVYIFMDAFFQQLWVVHCSCFSLLLMIHVVKDAKLKVNISYSNILLQAMIRTAVLPPVDNCDKMFCYTLEVLIFFSFNFDD